MLQRDDVVGHVSRRDEDVRRPTVAVRGDQLDRHVEPDGVASRGVQADRAARLPGTRDLGVECPDRRAVLALEELPERPPDDLVRVHPEDRAHGGADLEAAAGHGEDGDDVGVRVRHLGTPRRRRAHPGARLTKLVRRHRPPHRVIGRGRLCLTARSGHFPIVRTSRHQPVGVRPRSATGTERPGGAMRRRAPRPDDCGRSTRCRAGPVRGDRAVRAAVELASVDPSVLPSVLASVDPSVVPRCWCPLQPWRPRCQPWRPRCAR